MAKPCLRVFVWLVTQPAVATEFFLAREARIFVRFATKNRKNLMPKITVMRLAFSARLAENHENSKPDCAKS